MICKECGKENPDGMSYCMSCGAILGNNKKCEVCGNLIPEDAKHCPHCGSKQGFGAGLWRAFSDAYNTSKSSRKSKKKGWW